MIFLVALLLLAPALHADEPDEKAPLESLSLKPMMPSALEMTFSLDGGKAAVNDEVIPLTPAQVAMRSDASQLQLPVLPTIPEAPFVVQPFRANSAKELDQWEFILVDDQNRQIYVSSGTDMLPNPLTWDGRVDGELVMKPDQSYLPLLILKSSGSVSRVSGEAERYLAFSVRQEEDEVIYFGERLYQKEQPSFSPEAEIYLLDLARRLSQMGLHRSSWFVSIYQPMEDEALGEIRRKAWKTFLEKTLQRKIGNNQVVLYPGQDNHCITKIVLKNFSDPNHPVMTGKVSEPRPAMENVNKWMSVKENNKAITIELRQDRLFRSGSAYIRDEALPLIVSAQNLIKDAYKEKKSKDHKTVFLRSKSFSDEDEDPALTALRNKVLFMIFAESAYLSSN